MVEAALDFFFDMINWVFNDFLMQIKILGIPLLFYFLAIMILGIIITALINPANAGNLIYSASTARNRAEKRELRQAALNRVRSKK